MPITCAKKANSKFRFRKSPITLLEVLIALAVIALVGGAIAWNVRKLYLQQKTLDEMHRVGLLIRKAEELMMIANLDSDISFDQEGDLIRVSLIPKSAVSQSMKPLLVGSSLLLRYVDAIAFEDAFAETVLTPKFSLTFISRGYLMNRGVLQMRGNEVTRSIILYGYPTSVVLLDGEKVFFPYSNELDDEIQQLMEQTALETPIQT
jgi:hypothetical protein